MQESKLHDLKGRIDYISNPKRQEYLYAVYDTADPLFWRELAKENMRIHKESGMKGKCIEARELIIALPEPLTEKDPEELLRGVVEWFRKKYGVDCVAALHHNKRKTNYHIHLIFSERKRKEVVNEKIATRNMFYDENGKHVRTKKEILDENGNIREGCYIIKKGEAYERDIFTAKDKQFKSRAFLKEAKVYMMDYINTLLPENYPKLTIFDDEEVYLPMLKIGKNNPKEAEIKAANELRREWNQMADQALVEGVPQADIKKIKQIEIKEKVQKSIKENGKAPGMFDQIVRNAIQHLRALILNIRDRIKEIGELTIELPQPVKEEAPKIPEPEGTSVPERPEEPELSKKFKGYYATHKKLENTGKEIKNLEDKLESLQKKLSQTTGFFQGKERNRIISEIADTQVEISQKRASLGRIAIKAKCLSVDDFYTKYNASKASHNEYQKKLKVWEAKYGSAEDTSAPLEPVKKEAPKKESDRVSTPKRQLNKVSLKAALKEKKDIVKARDEQKDRSLKRGKDRNVGLE